MSKSISSSHSFYVLSVVCIALLLGISNCRKEKFFTESSAKLEISKDTVVFDTVFTTIGSTYKKFSVFNPYNKTVILSNVRLGKSNASQFRINVDGLSGVSINEVEIPAKDSVFVFVEVTIDPTNVNAPFVVEDDIYFTTNGNEQLVHLAAWGQNAYFHYNTLVCNETWANDKPHVLYGITAVGFPGIDSNCTLNIPAGTLIYAHSEAVLYVYKSSLNINGTLGNEVVFQGDRREASFSDQPGQWFGIRFAIAQNSIINYAIIKNGTAGIYADTSFKNGPKSDSIIITNTQSSNHSFASLFAQGAHIHAENSQFGKAGNNSVALRLGGEYYFNHCTFNNYWTSSTRNSPALILNNYYEVGNTVYERQIERLRIHNTIIYGNNDNEITLDTVPVANAANYLINHCMVKTDQPTTSKFVDNLINVDPIFIGFNTGKISGASPAKGKADSNYPLSKDIAGETRAPIATIGCYE